MLVPAFFYGYFGIDVLAYFARLGQVSRYSVATGLSVILCTILLFALYDTIVWRRRTSQRDGVPCASCLYTLQEDEPDGRCPECGQDYTIEDLRALWAEQRRQESFALQLDLIFLGDGFADQPGAIARYRQRMIALGLAHRFLFVLFLSAVPMWILLFSRPTEILYYFVGVFLVENIILFGVYLPMESRWQHRIRNASSLLCPECLAPLDTTQTRGTCQKCGIAFARDEVEALWTKERERADWPKFSSRTRSNRKVPS